MCLFLSPISNHHFHKAGQGNSKFVWVVDIGAIEFSQICVGIILSVSPSISNVWQYEAIVEAQ